MLYFWGVKGWEEGEGFLDRSSSQGNVFHRNHAVCNFSSALDHLEDSGLVVDVMQLRLAKQKVKGWVGMLQ